MMTLYPVTRASSTAPEYCDAPQVSVPCTFPPSAWVSVKLAVQTLHLPPPHGSVVVVAVVVLRVCVVIVVVVEVSVWGVVVVDVSVVVVVVTVVESLV